jgi:hypothetical protein
MKQYAKNSDMTKKNFNFQLQNIDVVDVILKHPEKQLPKECQYNFDINIQHNINDKDKLIVVAPTISIRINNEKITYGRFKANIFFQVQNLDDFKNQDTFKFDIPETFITTLNSISISTSRGLLFSAFKGTFLHNAILPIVNPGDFKKETE